MYCKNKQRKTFSSQPKKNRNKENWRKKREEEVRIQYGIDLNQYYCND